VKTAEDPALPERIKAWLRSDGGDQALLLITVDGQQRPHVAMLARDEARVMAANVVRVAVGERTRSAENLRARGAATLAIYDAGLACIIKTRAAGPPLPLMTGRSFCDLAVEEVRFDAPSPEEGAARLVSGLRFEGRPRRDDIQEALARA